MPSSWIPEPVGMVWVALFAAVTVNHVGHAVFLPGRHRRWHAGHVLMAVGMTVMFWPGAGMLVATSAGVVVYAAAAALLATVLVVAGVRGARVGRLWLLSVADLAAMAYMLAMMSSRVAWLSVVAAVWFAAQAVGWASGWFGRVLERGGLGEPAPPTHAATPLSGAVPASRAGGPDPRAQPADRQDAGATRTTTGARVVTALRRRVVDGGRGDWSVRISLTVMAVGMAYMLLAMQFGVDTAGMMPDMGEM